MIRCRVPSAIFAGLVLLAACGGEEPGPGTKAVGGDAAPAAGAADEEVVLDYERAPVPDPRPYEGSDLRASATAQGLFLDLPAASPEALGDLLRAFDRSRRQARREPGEVTGGPAGESYQPSRAELLAAELAARIEEALRRVPEDDRVPLPPDRMLQPDALSFVTFREVTVKVFGTGYVTVLDKLERSLEVPWMPRSLVERAQRMAQIARSQSNLRNLALLFVERATRKGWANAARLPGKRLVLSLVALNLIDGRNRDNLRVFFSPGDATRSLEAVDPARYDALTLESLSQNVDVDDLTSYVGPRTDTDCAFTPARLAQVVPLFADLSFPDVVLVAFTDASVRVLSREDLGLAPEDEIEVGPGSKSELLRCLAP